MKIDISKLINLKNKKTTEEKIKNFENKLKKTLPEDYKWFLLNCNGAETEDFDCYYYSDDPFEYVDINLFFELKEIVNPEYKVFSKYPENWVLIGQSYAMGLYFLSLNEEDYQSIYVWDQAHEDSSESVFVCEGFSKFINGLEKDREIPEFQYLANKRKFRELKEFIINNRIDINSKNHEGKSLFNIVVEASPPKDEWNKSEFKGSFNEACELIKFLFKNKVNKEEINLSCNFDVFNFVLDLGYDINQKNKKGETHLMIKAYRGDFETIKFLLLNGADKNIIDNNRKRAYDYAVQGFNDRNKNQINENVLNILK